MVACAGDNWPRDRMATKGARVQCMGYAVSARELIICVRKPNWRSPDHKFLRALAEEKSAAIRRWQRFDNFPAPPACCGRGDRPAADRCGVVDRVRGLATRSAAQSSLAAIDSISDTSWRCTV
ncbi:hypothetical protein ACVW17_006976 [Bradyrhizobium sp. USDA 4473]